MRLLRPTVIAFALLCAVASLGTPRYPDWGLLPNDPDPFCNLASGVGTTIYFRIGCECHVTIEITDGTGPIVVKTLVDEWMARGTHLTVWDGSDEAGIPVPDGTYRYTMVCRDAMEQVLYSASGDAHVWCASPVESLTWGTIKALYRP